MNIVISANGKHYKINTEEDDFFANVSHPLFKEVEAFGHEVIESLDKESQSMYFGSFDEMGGESYCSVKGATQDALHELIKHMETEKIKPLTITKETLYNIGLDACFET